MTGSFIFSLLNILHVKYTGQINVLVVPRLMFWRYQVHILVVLLSVHIQIFHGFPSLPR